MTLGDLYKWDLEGGTERERELLETMFKELQFDRQKSH